MYIQIKAGGTLHIKAEGKARTICGRAYAHLDFLPVSEEEFDSNQHTICHKCANTRREGPRTIKAAFTPEKMLG